jgi:hypothetical protein
MDLKEAKAWLKQEWLGGQRLYDSKFEEAVTILLAECERLEVESAELRTECEHAITDTRDVKRDLAAARRRVGEQVNYSVALQSIIEDLCRERPVRHQPLAPHHMEMATAYTYERMAQRRIALDGGEG